MGKKQHQKDKMYLTATEWSQFYGGKKNVAGSSSEFRRLPFDHCSLSLQPFEHPLCTPDGVVYELMHIVPFLKKHHVDPVSGKPLDSKALLKLNFTKNADDEYHCPVLFKVFNENSHIVAIKTTGNVFSHEAIEQLNLKNKNFKDLLTDEPFTKTDIITIQDPSNLEKFNFNNFHHVKNKLFVSEDAPGSSQDADGYHNLNSVNSVTKDVLDELKKESANKTAEQKTAEKAKADKFNAAHYSTGAVAASSTSTAVDMSTYHEAAILDDDIVRYARVKKKGYVQIVTNTGPLNLELHCDITPKACENFIQLSKKGYYDNTIFHRSIKNFMIQGGDPTGTGSGGESLWSKAFKDEFAPNLSHQGRGIVSMANSGPNTNKSQFFITYRSCTHLDKKHSIFGRVVGGLETISNMEKIKTDKDDRPLEKIEILKILIFVDPYQEVDDELAKLREKEISKPENSSTQKPPPAAKKLKTFHEGVGKYINTKALNTEESSKPAEVKKKRNITNTFNFNNW